MYPPKFDYECPQALDDVLAVLDQHGDEAKVLAGGQSLIPLLKLRFAEPSLLVDINRVPGLDAIEERGGRLVLGTRVRHAMLADSPLMRGKYSAISTAARWVADPLIRNLGTLGGSLAHADPQGDWGSVMLAMNAEVVIRRQGSERVVPMKDFFQGVFTSTLEPNELLTEVRVPVPDGPSGGTYVKLERKIGDFATVGVSVHVEMNNGAIKTAGIGLTAVGPQNIKAEDAEALLAGQAPSPELFRAAADAAVNETEPTEDIRGSVAYKKSVVRAYVERGLEEAVRIAQRS